MANSWSMQRGDLANPFWAWGYVQDGNGNRVAYPTIVVFDVNKNQYGEPYRGDGGGAWNLAIPSGDYILFFDTPAGQFIERASAVTGKTVTVQPEVVNEQEQNVSSIPMWMWIAGGAAVIYLFRNKIF